MEKQYKVKVTVRAEQSLREISHYIAVDLTEPQAAVKLLRTLQKAINSLDMVKFSLSGRRGWNKMDMLRVNLLYLTLRMGVKPIPIRERLQDPL